MAVYLVTYDLKEGEAARPDIVGAIKECGPWAMLSRTAYAIRSEATPEEIYDDLRLYVRDDEQLYIVMLCKPFFGQGDAQLNDWLADVLPWPEAAGRS